MNRKARTAPSGARPADRRSDAANPRPDRRRLYVALTGGVVATAVFVLLAFEALSAPSSGAAGQTVVQGRGGTWTDVTADRLATMMGSKDFTLVNVKTPYIGEIDGTDLYIPYEQLSARAAELPASKDAKVLVYCRSGVQSAQAAQALLYLGHRNVWNLDGGMNAWTSSGRTLVQKNR